MKVILIKYFIEFYISNDVITETFFFITKSSKSGARFFPHPAHLFPSFFFFLPSVGNHPNAQWKSDETNHGILLSNKEEGCTIDPCLDEMQGNYAKWKNRPRKDAYYPTSLRNSHEITCLQRWWTGRPCTFLCSLLSIKGKVRIER